MNYDEPRMKTTRLSDDGTRLVITERWLEPDVQNPYGPPRPRSKNWTRRLRPNEIEYYRQRLGTKWAP